MKFLLPDANEELLERQQLVFALVMLSIGITGFISAFGVIIDADSVLISALSFVRSISLIASILFVLYLFLLISTLRRRKVCMRLLEGFVQLANLKAMSISWTMTLVTLALLTEISGAGYVLPSNFYTRMASAVLMVTFSLSFFLLIRVPAEYDDD